MGYLFITKSMWVGSILLFVAFFGLMFAGGAGFYYPVWQDGVELMFFPGDIWMTGMVCLLLAAFSAGSFLVVWGTRRESWKKNALNNGFYLLSGIFSAEVLIRSMLDEFWKIHTHPFLLCGCVIVAVALMTFVLTIYERTHS